MFMFNMSEQIKILNIFFSFLALIFLPLISSASDSEGKKIHIHKNFVKDFSSTTIKADI